MAVEGEAQRPYLVVVAAHVGPKMRLLWMRPLAVWRQQQGWTCLGGAAQLAWAGKRPTALASVVQINCGMLSRGPGYSRLMVRLS